jgi:hypothetical protein
VLSSLANDTAATADGVGKSLTAAAVVREHGGPSAVSLAEIEFRPNNLSTASGGGREDASDQRQPRARSPIAPPMTVGAVRCDGTRAHGSTPPSPLTAKPGAGRLLGSSNIPFYLPWPWGLRIRKRCNTRFRGFKQKSSLSQELLSAHLKTRRIWSGRRALNSSPLIEVL